MIVARALKGGKLPTVVLEAEDGTVILKAYPNADETKIRIVLPELTDAGQCVGEVNGPWKGIIFTRSKDSRK